uniref:Uncharacterized protein n=1 Tax=Sphaerodactylus townsendi TaxID=933632 RepID=A0ACB8F0U4_9SAUR
MVVLLQFLEVCPGPVFPERVLKMPPQAPYKLVKIQCLPRIAPPAMPQPPLPDLVHLLSIIFKFILHRSHLGSHLHEEVGKCFSLKPLRSFFSSCLKSLPGVRRNLSPQLTAPIRQNNKDNTDIKEWKEYDKSKLFMADLESGLHYLFRVELATHRTLEGAALKTFKDFVTVLAKSAKSSPEPSSCGLHSVLPTYTWVSEQEELTDYQTANFILWSVMDVCLD